MTQPLRKDLRRYTIVQCQPDGVSCTLCSEGYNLRARQSPRSCVRVRVFAFVSFVFAPFVFTTRGLGGAGRRRPAPAALIMMPRCRKTKRPDRSRTIALV